MNFKKKISICALVIVLLLGLCVSTIPEIQERETATQFVIADLWEYPDNNGNGINRFHFYENSTGSWIQKYSSQGFKPTNGSNIIDWDIGVGIKLRMVVHLNSTFLGLGSIPEGLNYITLNVTVINQGETVFTQCNFTNVGTGQIGPIYSYTYEDVLNFSTNSGIYTATVTLEVFY